LVESFLEFLKSLVDCCDVRTLSLAEIHQEARPFGRRTQDRSLSFHSNLRNRSAGPAFSWSSAATGWLPPALASGSRPFGTVRTPRGAFGPTWKGLLWPGCNPSYNPEHTLLLPDHDPSASGTDPIQVCIAEPPENDRLRHLSSLEVDGLDVSEFDLSMFYNPEQIEGYAWRTKEEGRDYLAGCPGPHEEVVRAYE
jgi:hypothetical protein